MVVGTLAEIAMVRTEDAMTRGIRCSMLACVCRTQGKHSVLHGKVEHVLLRCTTVQQL